MGLDVDPCNAEVAPAGCDRNGLSHVCDEDAGHDVPVHVCACGHRWAEVDRG